MDLEECPKCGEVYPRTWGKCPTCEAGDYPDFRMRDEE